jgi:hypothetical protein
MTTTADKEELLVIDSYRIDEYTNMTDEDWLHPLLEIFKPIPPVKDETPRKLYLVPTQYEGEFDSDFAPTPTSASELPELQGWTERFAHNLVEIWAGRRSANQLEGQCHFTIYSELVRKSGSQKIVGRIRKIHIQEPLDGICEATVTVRFEDRLRSIILRFEGLDRRWLCTALTLL